MRTINPVRDVSLLLLSFQPLFLAEAFGGLPPRERGHVEMRDDAAATTTASSSSSAAAAAAEYDSDQNAAAAAAVAARLRHEAPVAIRKMTTDPDAMFFPSYWGFDGASTAILNSSVDDTVAMQPAILPIFSSSSSKKRSGPDHLSPPSFVDRLFPPAAGISRHHQRLKRAFTCPSGTEACSNINRADACCPTGLTCNIVQGGGGGGGGDVGCCAGAGCSGQLASCPAGYTECDSLGGGCCIPGYECVQGGCMAVDTIMATASSTRLTTTAAAAAPPTTSSSTPIQTTTVVSSSSTPPSTSSSTSPSSTASIVLPERPTSAASTSPQLPVTTVTPSASYCPTGFYQCSAYYNSGACCQVGRNCALTNCPASTPQTLLGSDGVTVVEPAVTASPDSGSERCAGGWFGCAAGVGGGCCPTGFHCGTASCWLNSTAQQTGGGSGDASTPKGKANAAASASTLPGGRAMLLLPCLLASAWTFA